MPLKILPRAGFPDVPLTPTIDMWGGVECTRNRVGDHYLDQMEFSGHLHRLTDYQSFREIGIRTLRVGVLWERHDIDPSWREADEEFRKVREAGIRPIVGLLHHGSGPRHTSLLDPGFPEKLAAYARGVAERYPWVDDYTPVNEPNTTARFSAMYGLWYPHHRTRRSYIRALLNQLKGTVLSMKAIRRVNSAARLIQTEDVGNITGTAPLRATCELLDLRQWLTYDLLCGRVDRHHPMFSYLRAEGVTEAEIFWFAEQACAPDVIGVNYYVTSDRYLDDRVELYPDDMRSAEGPFVDTETVRVSAAGIAGVESLLSRAWDRYRIPVAITEVHLGCTVDEQIRWLAEAWESAKRARARGVDCVAITAWALLGSFYWNQLVTCENGHYEPGAFDIRSGVPVRTPLAAVVKQIANGREPRHGALAHAGWWHQPNRMVCSAEPFAA